jgi:hypothetical protein
MVSGGPTTPSKFRSPRIWLLSLFCIANGTFCRNLRGDCFSTHLVQSNSYRLRLVSISCDPNFVFSIDGHSMTIIEVDGQNHEPLTVDSIQLFAGSLPTIQSDLPLDTFAAQRYSVILEANQPVGNYCTQSPRHRRHGLVLTIFRDSRAAQPHQSSADADRCGRW